MTASATATLSLRAEHAEHTRARLLEAAIEVLLSGGADELSLREVARQAGVSAPTAYRHFPTKPELLDAVIEHLDARLHIPRKIDSVEDFIEALPEIHQGFAENARLMRAYVRTRGAADLRQAGRSNRARRVSRALKHSLPATPEGELRALGPVLQLFASSGTWELWHELWQLEGERAGRVAAWAVKALYDAARKDPAAFARAAAPTRTPSAAPTTAAHRKPGKR